MSTVRLTAIVLHGRGQDPAFVHEHVISRLALEGVAYITPAAADRTWYPNSFLAPPADNEPKLSAALALIGSLLVTPAVLIGFSQGACLASEYVYRSRTGGPRPAALIAFTGGLLGPPGTTWDLGPANPEGSQARAVGSPARNADRAGAALGGMPVIISGSLHDTWVPAVRMRETASVLAGLGADVTTDLYDGDQHEIRDSEIAAARALLSRLLEGRA